MPSAMQSKLLRALEDGKVRPVGSETEVPFDVRLLAATNRDLETAMEEGRFRPDLFFRINVIQIDFPPLRPAVPTCCCWRSTLSKPVPRTRRSRCSVFPRPWPSGCWRTAGRATSASCAT